MKARNIEKTEGQKRMKLVSKQIFLNSVACLTLGWLMRSGEIDKMLPEASLGDKFRMEQGLEIGNRSRQAFGVGVLVNDINLTSAAQRTANLMSDPKVSVIFEGTFLVDNMAAKADVLKRTGRTSWQLTEVKSSANDKSEFIDDMAYTLMVAARCGVPISKVTLMLVSKDFRLGMGNDKLFVEIEHTDEVQQRAALFEPLLQQIEEKTRSSTMPPPEVVFECRQCPIFEQCAGQGVKNHIFDIPRISKAKFEELKRQGFLCIENIPDGFSLTDNQEIVRQCVKTKKARVGNELKTQLASIRFPAYYLDFETVMTALPLYPNIAPYTQLPTQYSIHQCSAVGKVTNHYEYLSDPSFDSRRDLANQLIKDIGKVGSVIAYSSFEKTIINKLAREFPEMSAELALIADRIVDLNSIVSKSVYHPDFHGSTSIKVTLPVFAPELSYGDLNIRDGDSAVVTFAYLALGRLTGKEAETAKRNLLSYCERDTLAMVELHKQLFSLV